MTPATAILVPVLNRPQNVAPLVESIEAMTPEPHHVRFLPSVGDDAEIEALHEARCDYTYTNGVHTWAQKINLGFRETVTPFVFLAADDLRFHDGWLAEALDVMEHCGVVAREPDDQPDWNRPAVVGTNDLCNARTFDHSDPGYPHSTHTLVRRSYIDEHGGTLDQGPGVVLCEEYPHEYADDELVETAKHRGVYAHADTAVVEHLHPNCGKADDDDTYAWGRSRTSDARGIYNRRASELGFAEPRGRSWRVAQLVRKRERRRRG